MRRFLPLSAMALGLMICAVSPTTIHAGVRQQLSVTIPDVPFNGVPLSDAIDFMRDVSGANIAVNWKALEEAGVSRETPINVRLRGVSLRKVLEIVLAQAGGGQALGYDIDQNVITITTRELADSRMFTRVYPIQDLIDIIPDFTDAPDFSLNSTSNNSNQNPSAKGGSSGGGSSGGSLFGGEGGKEKAEPTRAERAADLMALIRDIVQPEIWVDNGGKASIRYWNGNLIVTAPRSVQEAIGGPWGD